MDVDNAFERVGTRKKLSKLAFNARLPQLRSQLLNMQRELRAANFPVIVVLGGVDGAGKGETVGMLNEWLDPRGLVSNAYDLPSDEEAERPSWWRYWRDLPPKGHIGLFLSSWYSKPLVDWVHYRSPDQALADSLADIQRFERSLCDNGALIIKLWLHLDRKAQQKHFEKLEQDPNKRVQLRDTDWLNWSRYARFQAAAKTMIKQTHAPQREWTLIDGYNERQRVVAVAEVLLKRIQAHCQKTPERPAAPFVQGSSKLATLSMGQNLGNKLYKQRLQALQGELARLRRMAWARKVSTTIVFEGWDAAGKGGAIRRLIHPLDAKHYRVIPIAAPTQEELAQHYLWRFWRHVPRDGKVTLFDRSWYGRALVERVEGFCSEADWQRSYQEINEFEQALCDHGGVLCKFWLHITPEEQLKRFKLREVTPYKSWKLTDEDWRNREKWSLYEQAAEDIFANCSPATAPWTLVPANHKRYARIHVLETVCQSLRQALGDG